ncbi:MAG: hypothetical protein CFE28_14640 [Alphaproteobacteria bacterium PA2]|nr:MAG: hypothetical protein CFE28_14640 [Alphaproteobacteria bacterium PA2]
MTEQYISPQGIPDRMSDRITAQDEAVIRSRREKEHAHALRHGSNSSLLAGIVIGGVIAMGATAYFARESGSFANAGGAVDRSIESTTAASQSATADAAQSVGSAAHNAGEAVDKSMSDVAAKTRPE